VVTYQSAGMSALGDPTRRVIFELLADGPRPVGEIAGELPISRPAVSQHLKVLKDAGLVIDHQSGTRRLYQLNPEAIGALRAYFDRFWNQALAAFRQAVEQTNQGGAMNTQTIDTSVRTAVVVEAPIERAFSVFTEGIGTWWSPDHHILQGELAEMVFEPRQGGHVYDRGVDGSECRWARVLVFEPPNRVVIGWDISLQWQLEPDPTRASEIDVRFVPEGPNRTRVELEHRHLDRHGDGWEQMRDAVGSPDGWQKSLRRYVQLLNG
jgi:DNA-binding transcriptional ArsR family regulator/uncharacterized protein YndB with AHSA1/START domain